MDTLTRERASRQKKELALRLDRRMRELRKILDLELGQAVLESSQLIGIDEQCPRCPSCGGALP